MEENGTDVGIGHRIRSVRRARGIKSTADLAALIPGANISGAVLRNIEAGVKIDLTVSQLLNIARALTVSPIFLLASIREPDSRLDIPNLSAALRQMSAIEFDEWLSGNSDGIHEWTTVEDHSERSQLRAMRELERQVRERDRLTLLLNSEEDIGLIGENYSVDTGALTSRKADVIRQAEHLSRYLQSAGWNVDRWR